MLKWCVEFHFKNGLIDKELFYDGTDENATVKVETIYIRNGQSVVERSTFIDNVYDFYKPNPASEYPTVDGKVSI